MTGGIYEIRNKVNGKYYLGRAERFKARFNRHRYDLRRGRHPCLYLQRAWNKYGEDAFEFVAVIECIVEAAQKVEEERLSSGDRLLYTVSRMSSGGDGLTNHPHREQIVARQSAAACVAMAALSPQERIRRYGRSGERTGMAGRRQTEESRQTMSETTLLNMKRGPEHPNFGLKRSQETRDRLSEIASSRTGDRNPFYGKSHSEATREKLAAQRRGRLPTNCRAVMVEGVTFPSVTEAARQLNVSPALVIYRLKSSRSPYSYVEAEP